MIEDALSVSVLLRSTADAPKILNCLQTQKGIAYNADEVLRALTRYRLANSLSVLEVTEPG